MTQNNGPEHIWLAPACHELTVEERQWRADNVWDDGCDVCNEAPVKYIRVDLHETLVAKLEAEIEKLERELARPGS